MSGAPPGGGEVLRLVRLHVAGGCVWYGHDGLPERNSLRSVEEFLGGTVGVATGRAAAVRLLGVPGNAELIVRLYRTRALRHESCVQRIELGAPTLLARAVDRDCPHKALLALWQSEPSALACGGFHDMAAVDLPSYALVASLRGPGPGGLDRAVRVLPGHPAWPALSFLPHLSRPTAVRLLAEIVDPRWYRHPFRPHRVSRLLGYLGVSPDNMRAYTGVGVPGRHYGRAALVLDTWFDINRLGNSRQDAAFLDRVFLTAADPAAGLLRASRRFVRFLYEVWLAGLSGRGGECGFLAGEFFTARECAAWERHLGGLAG